MLTIEMLQQNASLASLTDEQKNVIVEMSRNDENTVIGTKIGALHGQYDTDIFSITGIKKNDGEKSYDYLKRILSNNKTEITSIKSQLTTAKSKVTELEKQIAAGNQDETLKQQLQDNKNQITKLQTQLSAKQEEFDTEKAKLEKQLQTVHVDYAFSSAVSGLKFKTSIPEAVQTTLLNAAKQEVLSKGTPEFQTGADGTKKLVFRGPDGNILLNAKTNLNPYTFKELIMETSIKDAIDDGKHTQGGGTGASSTGGSSGAVLDFSSAKTQIEADRVIENYLLGNGITRDSEEFAEQSMKLRTENEIEKLPIR